MATQAEARPRLLSVTPSPAFLPNAYRGGTTTWAMIEHPDGSVEDVLVEQALDLQTAWPLDPNMNGMAGDYSAFKYAQQHGVKSAEAYAKRHAETHNDGDDTERTRQIILRNVRAVSRQWAEQEQADRLKGDKRLLNLLTNKKQADGTQDQGRHRRA